MKSAHSRPAMLARAAALSILVLGFTAGCRGTVPIGELLDDPGRYDGETVRVKGRVTESVGALGYGGYRIQDGTGTLNVVSRGRGAPTEGARVGIEGIFHSVFTFGNRSEAVLEERDRFDP
ncbi:MAG: hypothetical protein KY397_02970 [Gemmatimonadetes bacterium]|nr:hypothetical protein [Gemmatimonadota bacterium]